MDLRRPKDFTGTRFGFINESTNSNPRWITKQDKILNLENVEIIRNSSIHTSDILNTSVNASSYMNSHYICNTCESNRISIKEYEYVGKIVVIQ